MSEKQLKEKATTREKSLCPSWHTCVAAPTRASSLSLGTLGKQASPLSPKKQCGHSPWSEMFLQTLRWLDQWFTFSSCHSWSYQAPFLSVTSTQSQSLLLHSINHPLSSQPHYYYFNSGPLCLLSRDNLRSLDVLNIEKNVGSSTLTYL